MKKKPQIKKIDYGIACKIGSTIYLNKNLDKHPKLKKALLNHEQEHSDTYEIKDVLVDLGGKHLENVKREYYSFIFNNPKSLITFFPVWKYGGTLVYDPIMIAFWLLGIGYFFLLNAIK